MSETKIGSALAGIDSHTDYSVDTQSLDSPSTSGETRWENNDWDQNLGYYKEIPEVRAVIDAKASWTVGKGFSADTDTTLILDNIDGFGKDTFNTILENMIRTMHISGDSYAHRITNDDGELVNLKPFDPSKIAHIANSDGLIIRYELTVKHGVKKFQPEDIFHLCRNRIGDEIHGVSMIDSLVNIILMKNEAMADWKRVLHRNVDPVWVIHMDTDDDTEMAAFKKKMDDLRGKNEQNIYVPKDVIVPEMISVAPNSSLNPLAWIESLDDKFYQASGVPKFILGGLGGITEAAVKTGYLAFQQTIEEHQLQIEEQVGKQLGLEIELEFPASMENELLSDQKKDKETGVSKPSDTEA